eukprot:jgi/Tetstr1/435508/TSEL_024412.t1
MSLSSVAPGLLATRRRRLLVLGALGLAAAGVAAHRSGALAAVRARWAGWTRLAASLSAAAADGSAAAALLAADLRAFLASEADELPGSLAQLAKLLSSRQAGATYTTLAASLMAAASQGQVGGGCKGDADGGGKTDSAGLRPGVADRFLELLFSARGEGLLSVAVGMAARSSVEAVTTALAEQRSAVSAAGGGGADRSGSGDQLNGGVAALLAVVSDPEGQRALSAFIATFVATGVSTYFDATRGHNYYEDLVASVATPSNRAAVEHISAHVCREAIGAYLTFSTGGRPVLERGEVEAGGEDVEEGAGPGDGCSEAEVISKVLSYDGEVGVASATRTAAKAPRPSRLAVPGSAPPATVPAPRRRPPAGAPGDGVIGQLFQAASTAEGRRLVVELASSVTAEAVRTGVGAVGEAIGFSWRSRRANGVPGKSGRETEEGAEGRTLVSCVPAQAALCAVLCLGAALLLAAALAYFRAAPADLGMAQWQPPPTGMAP